MAAANPPSMPTLLQRFARLLPFVRDSRAGLFGAALGSVVTAITEPMIPALMSQLLDRGFSAGQLALWMVPVAIIGLFALRSAASFVAQYGLAWTAGIAILVAMLALLPVLFARSGRDPVAEELAR